MIHAFFVVGEIKKISIGKPKDPKKTASAVLLVQLSVQRESGRGSRNLKNVPTAGSERFRGGRDLLLAVDPHADAPVRQRVQHVHNRESRLRTDCKGLRAVASGARRQRGCRSRRTADIVGKGGRDAGGYA